MKQYRIVTNGRGFKGQYKPWSWWPWWTDNTSVWPAKTQVENIMVSRLDELGPWKQVEMLGVGK